MNDRLRRVILESPYAGDVEANLAYAKRALRDSISRGEAPFASHLLYTQVLDDLLPAERQLGIHAGLTWLDQAETMAVYLDLGLSQGMKIGIAAALIAGIPVEYRRLDNLDA